MSDRALMQQALDALRQCEFTTPPAQRQIVKNALAALNERLARPEQEPNKDGSPCPEFWDWLPKAYNFDGNGAFTKYNMEVAFLAGKQTSQPAQQEPVAWGCNRYIEDDNGFQIGTDEPELAWGKYAPDDNGWWPLYTSPQPAQQEPVACPYCHNSATLGSVYYDQNCVGCVKRMTTPPRRKPLTWERVLEIGLECANDRSRLPFEVKVARAIEAAHGIKENT